MHKNRVTKRNYRIGGCSSTSNYFNPRSCVAIHTGEETNNISLHIKELVYEKRSARCRWQNTRSPLDKTHLNRLTHNLRLAIRQARNDTFKLYTANLTPDDHSLWKATKRFKRPTMAIPLLRKQDSSWARSNMEKSPVSCKSFHTTSQEHQWRRNWNLFRRSMSDVTTTQSFFTHKGTPCYKST